MKNAQHTRRWRLVFWSLPVLLLLLPLVAMLFTDEVRWTLGDFIFAGILLFGTGLTYELFARKGSSGAYRLATGLALAAGVLIIWLSGAVGIIGPEDHPANLMYIGVLAIGLGGAFVACFEPHGMARALFATALAHLLVVVLALVAGWGEPWSQPTEIVFLNGFFITLWLLSAQQFLQAAQEEPVADDVTTP